jgi:hypothetical protein
MWTVDTNPSGDVGSQVKQMLQDLLAVLPPGASKPVIKGTQFLAHHLVSTQGKVIAAVVFMCCFILLVQTNDRSFVKVLFKKKHVMGFSRYFDRTYIQCE